MAMPEPLEVERIVRCPSCETVYDYIASFSLVGRTDDDRLVRECPTCGQHVVKPDSE